MKFVNISDHISALAKSHSLYKGKANRATRDKINVKIDVLKKMRSKYKDLISDLEIYEEVMYLEGQLKKIWSCENERRKMMLQIEALEALLRTPRIYQKRVKDISQEAYRQKEWHLPNSSKNTSQLSGKKTPVLSNK